MRCYGMTLDDYDRMLAAQGGGCGVCGSAKAYGMGTSFPIDHDQNCCDPGKGCPKCIRGLVCHRCNLRIGWLEWWRKQIELFLLQRPLKEEV